MIRSSGATANKSETRVAARPTRSKFSNISRLGTPRKTSRRASIRGSPASTFKTSVMLANNKSGSATLDKSTTYTWSSKNSRRFVPTSNANRVLPAPGGPKIVISLVDPSRNSPEHSFCSVTRSTKELPRRFKLLGGRTGSDAFGPAEWKAA